MAFTYLGIYKVYLRKRKKGFVGAKRQDHTARDSLKQTELINEAFFNTILKIVNIHRFKLKVKLKCIDRT